jgi:penicillin-insensitive murein endopeptidase
LIATPGNSRRAGRARPRRLALLGLLAAVTAPAPGWPAPDAAAVSDGGAGDAPAASGAGRPAVPTLKSVAVLWNAQRTPATGPAQAIGGYAAGCLQGGQPLKPVGAGYRVLHLERRRNFGHPALVAFVRRLAATARQRRLGPLLVGDLSQARGGPAPTGHRSHQSGLDVDIGYTAPANANSAAPQGLSFVDVLDLRTRTMTRAWTSRITRLLQLAAEDPAVERIFVNPYIKRRICADTRRPAPWLGRLRPWSGHQDHFHVRLRCPPDSPTCQSQDPVPSDDGCAALEWWFSEDAAAAAARRQKTETEAPPPFTLPPACSALLPPPGTAKSF